MKILLLGSGYIGIALLAHWQNTNHQLTVTTTRNEKIPTLAEFQCAPVVLDSANLKKLDDAILQCDVVVITVAPNQATYEQIYLQTAKNVKKSIRDRNRPLHIIYTGSTSVYGDQKGLEVNETASLNPQSENSKILKQAEEVYLSCQNELVDVCILRLGGIHGPGREIAKRAKRMSGKEIGGKKNSPTNSSHRDDIVQAIDFSLNQGLQGVFNVVSDHHPTREELYNELCAQLNLPPPIWSDLSQGSHQTDAIVANQKIKNLGFIFDN